MLTRKDERHTQVTHLASWPSLKKVLTAALKAGRERTCIALESVSPTIEDTERTSESGRRVGDDGEGAKLRTGSSQLGKMMGGREGIPWDISTGSGYVLKHVGNASATTSSTALQQDKRSSTDAEYEANEKPSGGGREGRKVGDDGFGEIPSPFITFPGTGAKPDVGKFG